MRTLGTVPSASDLAPGDHACWVYDSDESHHTAVGAYLAAGLRVNQKLLYFGYRYGPDDVLGAIRRYGVDPEPARQSGQLTILPAEAAYLSDGRFDPDRMVGAFEQGALGARDEGYDRLRAAGETAWLLPGWLDPDTLITYEMACDQVVASTGMLGLCGYDSRTCDPSSIARAQMAHPARVLPPGAAEAMFGIAHTDSGIGVWGELDISALEPFRVAIRGIVDRVDQPVIDFAGLRFIDVACLRVLISEATAIAPRRFTLRAVPRAARRSLDFLRSGMPPNLVLAEGEPRPHHSLQ